MNEPLGHLDHRLAAELRVGLDGRLAVGRFQPPKCKCVVCSHPAGRNLSTDYEGGIWWGRGGVEAPLVGVHL